jgi:hypothetical protein
MMKTNYSICAMAFVSIIIASCQKNVVTQTNSLLGNWNFESEQVYSQSTIEYMSSGIDYKTVTISNYTTINNIGALTITSDMMTSSGLAYTIADSAIGYNYQNGVFIDSVVQFVNENVPPTSSIVSYVLVGSDSIYFPNGSFSAPSGFQAAGGARVNISGDTLLTMTTSFSKDSSIFLYGMPATASYQAMLVSKFH